MNKILVVDDDLDIRNVLRVYLTNNNFEVDFAVDGKDALNKLDDSFDLVLLDIMMPNLDGIETVQEIRKISNVPVMFISARSSDASKFEGLMLGADDYITKPFNPMDVVTKANVLIRRYKVLGSKGNTSQFKSSVIELDNLKIYLDEFKVERDSKELKLTKTEFKILKLLVENRGIVFSSDRINEIVFEDQFGYTYSNNISVHIKNLRDKIETDTKNPKIIKNVWGVGYKIEK